MIGVWVANLLIPGEPSNLTLKTPLGPWELGQYAKYADSKVAMSEHKCAHTYYLEHDVELSNGAAAFDAVDSELTPIFLAASYATALSVSSRQSTPHSEMQIMEASHHWPRIRSMGLPNSVVTNPKEFSDLVEAFVLSWPSSGKIEKARILVHHWLDALSCWSMEDLYLSATTLLQVIVATEAGLQGRAEIPYYDGVTAAATRKGIRQLPPDFKNMRNELIHDGQLIGRRFAGPDRAACAAVIVDLLNWFDEYVHEALNLGKPRIVRFKVNDLGGLNAYSID